MRAKTLRDLARYSISLNLEKYRGGRGQPLGGSVPGLIQSFGAQTFDSAVRVSGFYQIPPDNAEATGKLALSATSASARQITELIAPFAPAVAGRLNAMAAAPKHVIHRTPRRIVRRRATESGGFAHSEPRLPAPRPPVLSRIRPYLAVTAILLRSARKWVHYRG